MELHLFLSLFLAKRSSIHLNLCTVLPICKMCKTAMRLLSIINLKEYYLHTSLAQFKWILVWFGFVVRGESPGCRLISTASMLEWLRNHLPHHSQGSSMEIWSRNTLRVVTARVFYVLRGFLMSPFILNNSVEMTAPFNVVSHPRCSESRN